MWLISWIFRLLQLPSERGANSRRADEEDEEDDEDDEDDEAPPF